MLIPRQQNLWTITTRKKTRFCVSFFVLVRFCSAKPVACGRVTERARETRLRFPLHTFPSLRYAGVRTTKVVGNHNTKKTRFCVSFFVLVRFCSAKPVACGRVTERARETRLRFPLHTFPSLRYAGVRTTKVVGNHTRLQKPMAFEGCPLPQLTNTAVPWYNETPKQVWIFLEHCLHFSPRIRQGVRRFFIKRNDG